MSSPLQLSPRDSISSLFFLEWRLFVSAQCFFSFSSLSPFSKYPQFHSNQPCLPTLDLSNDSHGLGWRSHGAPPLPPELLTYDGKGWRHIKLFTCKPIWYQWIIPHSWLYTWLWSNSMDYKHKNLLTRERDLRARKQRLLQGKGCSLNIIRMD